jgi:hypothetical protein
MPPTTGQLHRCVQDDVATAAAVQGADSEPEETSGTEPAGKRWLGYAFASRVDQGHRAS